MLQGDITVTSRVTSGDAADKEVDKEKEKELDVAVATTAATDSPFEEEYETDDRDNTLRVWEGSLGRGVVMLTDNQMDSLIDKLGLDGFHYYISKLADFIIEKEAKVANHYATILKWAREDAKV
jgi:hypothetical protein